MRDRLAQILKQQRGDYSHALAEHWQGQPVKRSGDAELAAARGDGAALAALLLVGTYWALSSSLESRSDPVFGDIQGLRLTPPVAATPQPAPKPRLAQFLQPDIKAEPGARAATRSIAASSRSAATARSRPAARRCCPSARR